MSVCSRHVEVDWSSPSAEYEHALWDRRWKHDWLTSMRRVAKPLSLSACALCLCMLYAMLCFYAVRFMLCSVQLTALACCHFAAKICLRGILCGQHSNFDGCEHTKREHTSAYKWCTSEIDCGSIAWMYASAKKWNTCLFVTSFDVQAEPRQGRSFQIKYSICTLV